MGEGEGGGEMIDARSQKNLDTLLPKVKPVMEAFVIEAKKHFQEKGVDCIVICGTRTYAEQDRLYAQGRTAPGNIVTKARGGESRHNFGLAIDIGLFVNKKYLEDSPFYDHIGPIVAKFPQLEWGGNWKFVDEPHVEYRTGLSLAQMRERVKAGKSIV
jgi:peptidoglycan L-alanyl-D-glutamate endopeptidase CwlK